MSWSRSAYRCRALLVLVPAFVGFLLPDHGSLDDLFEWTIGGLLFAAAMAVRVLAQYHLAYRLRESTRLTRTGPYRYVRNPIYIANSLVVLSVVIMMEVPWLIPFAGLWCAILYSVVVRYEEQHLLDKYGDAYRAYLNEVPRWFPRRSRSTKGKMAVIRGRLKAAVVAEWHLCAVILAPAVKEVLEKWVWV